MNVFFYRIRHGSNEGEMRVNGIVPITMKRISADVQRGDIFV